MKKICLIPCLLQHSTQVADNPRKFKNVEFERVMPKFTINHDGLCPKNFKYDQISSENENFNSAFIELENKAVDFWLDFASKHLNERLTKNRPEGTWSKDWFYLDIRSEYREGFAFLVDKLPGIAVLRFFIG